MSKREAYELETKKDGAPVFWKSLEQKKSPELAAKQATAEFPREQTGSDFGLGPTGRRGFLFGGLSAALLAVEGCARRPVENILPYAKAPEYMLPGIPVHYATVRAHRGDAMGLLVENHEGRPTKIEGNPQHPSSLGAADVLTQATLLDLYDPDRSNGPRKAGADAKWDEFEAVMKAKVASFAADGGAKLRVLAQPSNSPTFIRLRDMLNARLPRARVHTWAPVNESSAREGARIAFGQPVNVVCDYRASRVILSLDSDFLQTEPGMVRATKHFAAGRKLHSAHESMSRLYVVEPSYTTTGANADHRLRLPSSRIGSYLVALAKELATRPSLDLATISAAFANAGPVERGPREVDQGRRRRARAEPWPRDHRRRLGPAGARPRARPRAEQRPRQRRRHRQLLHGRGPEPHRAHAGPESPRGRHRREPRRDPPHPRRKPGLRRAGRLQVRREAREGPDEHSPVALGRRDRVEVHVAPAARTRARGVGRREVARRDALNPTADNRAALRRAERHRDPRDARRRAHERARPGSRHREGSRTGERAARGDVEGGALSRPLRRRDASPDGAAPRRARNRRGRRDPARPPLRHSVRATSRSTSPPIRSSSTAATRTTRGSSSSRI